MAPSTGIRIPAFAATIPTAMFAMDRMAWARPMPPLCRDSLRTLNYGDFLAVVAGGRKNVNSAQENVMPAFGTSANVMCYLDDIFVYLRARANDAVGRGRPEKHAEKPAAASAAEDTCFGAKH